MHLHLLPSKTTESINELNESVHESDQFFERPGCHFFWMCEGLTEL